MNWIISELGKNSLLPALDYKQKITCCSLIEEALIIVSDFQKNPRPLVIIKPNLYEAERLFDRCSTLTARENLIFYKVEESLRVNSIASSPEMIAQNINHLAELCNNPNKIIITFSSAFTSYTPAKNTFLTKTIHLKKQQIMELEQLKSLLLQAGYQFVSHVDQPLCYSFRGGVVDFFSMNNDYPCRVEFFDNEIESIRFFDPDTQKTMQEIEQVTCIPATDILFSLAEIKEIKTNVLQTLKPSASLNLQACIQNDLSDLEQFQHDRRLYIYHAYLTSPSSLTDYLPNATIVLINYAEISDHLKHQTQENVQYLQEMIQEEKILPKFSFQHDLHQLLKKQKVVDIDCENEHLSFIKPLNLERNDLLANLKILYQNSLSNRVLFCLKEHEIRQVKHEYEQLKINYQEINCLEQLTVGLNLTNWDIYEGFSCLSSNLIVVTGLELFKTKRNITKYTSKFKSAEVLKSYQDLNPNDYVVHNQYGVGQYLGLQTKEVLGIHKDFLKIAYKGNDLLLVPLEQFKLVRKFVSSGGVTPKLHKLGSDQWEKTKEKIRENVREIAKDLIALYQERENNIGYQYHEDTVEQQQFEQEFPYELTIDQQTAIQEIKQDMMSLKPMDRLLIGDVGFGKTEVAIRAAFKAVNEGKQVAFLCPTTILAHQHYQTFQERFKNYPVNIGLLNRFVSLSKQKENLKLLQQGKLDIIIGTHRILSSDLQFFDLGFLIIDEEQRFGVQHKEKIKLLKNSVDVLSLSATPIPRTLQMSLIGIRKCSQLKTAPQNRVAVMTNVVNKNPFLIKEVIQRELSRKGQVFYLHNNTSQIYHTARYLQELLPEATIVVAHGKMSREEIEDVMYSFTIGQADILVCTTIIETGIDIPNANTIIVEDAQNFGLAQLYQIKGRVGRSNRLAYAYLMVPEKKNLSEVSLKRLKAIKEFTRLGSGYQIAMRDLTIRGAGDMLGANQSGFIDTVGIDMYIEMLEEAIHEERGEEIITPLEVKKINLQQDAYIPENFAPLDYDKINMYQQIDQVNDLATLLALKQQVIDEYGRLPKTVNVLFDKKRLELLINEPSVDKFKEVAGKITIIFTKEFSDRLDGVKLFAIINNLSKDINLKYTNQKIYVNIPKTRKSLERAIEILVQVKNALKK